MGLPVPYKKHSLLKLMQNNHYFPKILLQPTILTISPKFVELLSLPNSKIVYLGGHLAIVTFNGTAHFKKCKQ